jgi:hypothetical protein
LEHVVEKGVVAGKKPNNGVANSNVELVPLYHTEKKRKEKIVFQFDT